MRFSAIQLMAKLRSLEQYRLCDTEITTTGDNGTCSSRQPHQSSKQRRKNTANELRVR